jgi:Fic family protein
MVQFDYDKILASLVTPEIMRAVDNLLEHKGRQNLYEATRKDILESLVEVAKIQSTDGSNRIENISTSDKRLRELADASTAPHNRDEREIMGYRYVLDMVHENHDFIPVTPGVILQLHRDLYRYEAAAFAGKWKDSDNVIAERTDAGQLVARFKPTPAALTPDAVGAICAEYSRQLEKGLYNPVLVALIFVFDFVCIHPFNDGNGRMSRLLTLLLLYRSGYTVGKFVSIEKEIERTKQTYYEALAAASVGWEAGAADYSPFVTYMLGVLTACYAELDCRVLALTASDGKEAALRAYLERTVAPVTKREIMDANPNISQRTVERVLSRLQQEGTIEKVGAARSTAYRWRGARK